MLGIFFGDGDQFFDHHTWQLHESPYATSDLEFKGALKGARAVGLLRVDQGERGRAEDRRLPAEPQPGASRDGARRLDPESRDRRQRCPLHPRRDDVAGRGGAPLLSPGARHPLTEAQKLIVEGFFRPVIDRIPVEEIQGFLEGASRRKVGVSRRPSSAAPATREPSQPAERIGEERVMAVTERWHTTQPDRLRRRGARPRRFPDPGPVAERGRPAAGLSRQRGQLAKAARGDRGARRLLPRRPTPTSTAASTSSPSGPRRSTKRRGTWSPISSTPTSPRECIFVRNTTEAINLVAHDLGPRATSSRAISIVVTEMEHHSNIVPWHLLAEQTGRPDRSDSADRRSRSSIWTRFDRAARRRSRNSSP